MSEPDLSGTHPNDCLAILVHGFFRTRRDMAFLDHGLQEHSYQTLRVNLPSTRGTLEDQVSALQQQIELPMKKVKRVVFIAHSMGGLVVRTFLAHVNSRANVTHCVFIATPHQGTPLADIMLNIPRYGAIFPAVKQLRSTPSNTYAAPLLHLVGNQGIATDIRIGVIVGDYLSRIYSLSIGKLFIPENSDGRVPATSAIAPDADAVLVVPFSHTSIHHRKATLNAILDFLATGHFAHSAAPQQTGALE
ncbi:MAG: alpha/beta fold hydrolase [Desulfuromonadaceae bacterium]|nr:alpha/beta fold hydrolase [Desulfuromonadaceae bacterium]